MYSFCNNGYFKNQMSGLHCNQFDILAFGNSPFKTELEKLLKFYPDRSNPNILLMGFKYGFKLNYARLRSSYAYDNLLSIKQIPELATKQSID